jgi:hypothetical protein
MLSWKRTLRTPSSERFRVQREGRDVAALDFPTNFPRCRSELSDAPIHFSFSDFPPFSFCRRLNHGNLHYTAVIGEILGNFEAPKTPIESSIRKALIK